MAVDSLGRESEDMLGQTLLVPRLQPRNAVEGGSCLLRPTNEAGASEAVRSWAGALEREHGLCDQAR